MIYETTPGKEAHYDIIEAFFDETIEMCLFQKQSHKFNEVG